MFNSLELPLLHVPDLFLLSIGRVFLSYCLFIVSFVLSIAVFASSLIVSIFFNRSSKLGISISTVRFPFQRCLP